MSYYPYRDSQAVNKFFWESIEHVKLNAIDAFTYTIPTFLIHIMKLILCIAPYVLTAYFAWTVFCILENIVFGRLGRVVHVTRTAPAAATRTVTVAEEIK